MHWWRSKGSDNSISKQTMSCTCLLWWRLYQIQFTYYSYSSEAGLQTKCRNSRVSIGYCTVNLKLTCLLLAYDIGTSLICVSRTLSSLLPFGKHQFSAQETCGNTPISELPSSSWVNVVTAHIHVVVSWWHRQRWSLSPRGSFRSFIFI